jgi:hypothetical protein
MTAGTPYDLIEPGTVEQLVEIENDPTFSWG